MARLLDDGFALMNVDYRPARTSAGDNFAQLAYDVDRAIRWIRAHHERLGIDPTRVIVSGHSAGAHLAAAVAVGGLPAPDDPTCDAGDVSCSPPLPAKLAVQSSRPDGLMLLAGPYDLADPILAERLLQLPDVDDVDEDGDTEELITLDPDPGTAQVEMLVENLLGCHPLATGCAGAVAEASPATDAHQPLLAGMPPTFIAHAENDDVVDPQQSLVMGYRLCLAGVEVHYEHMTTGGHALDDLSDDTVDQFLSAWNPATAPASPAPTTSSCNVP